MSNTHFAADFAKISAAVEPYVRTLDDGFSYIDDSCPAALLSAYRGIVSFGYANGLI